MPDDPLDAKGICVTVTDVEHRERFGGPGWPQWVIPFGGAEVSAGGITIAVRPAVEMPIGEWRSYSAIEALCAHSERAGGFMWHGDEIHVFAPDQDPAILVGRDAMKFLNQLGKRADARGGKSHSASYEQGFRDGVNAASKEVSQVLDSIEMLRPVPKPSAHS